MFWSKTKPNQNQTTTRMPEGPGALKCNACHCHHCPAKKTSTARRCWSRILNARVRCWWLNPNESHEQIGSNQNVYYNKQIKTDSHIFNYILPYCFQIFVICQSSCQLSQSFHFTPKKCLLSPVSCRLSPGSKREVRINLFLRFHSGVVLVCISHMDMI